MGHGLLQPRVQRWGAEEFLAERDQRIQVRGVQPCLVGALVVRLFQQPSLLAQRRGLARQLVGRALAVGHVAHDVGQQHAVGCADGTQTDLDRKDLGIFAPGHQLQSAAHRPGAWLGSICGTMMYVDLAQVFRQQ